MSLDARAATRRVAARPLPPGRICTALALALFSAPAHAAPPQVVLFGGGWGPEGNQASIEAHVTALRAGLPSTATVLFAAGRGGAPSVQEVEPTPDEDSFLLGLIFDRRDNLAVRYRPPRVDGAGRASRQALLRSIRTARARGDTIVFGAGHGAPATDDRPAALELWGPDDRVYVDELARGLDRDRGAHRVALVLGQCHGGAFADVMFVGGDPEVGLADPTRCAFAAVPADREAAGCTPDVEDLGARAYLAAIAEALSDRADADADRDGRLSLVEADAWARIHDRTVDVPVKSSDVWLDLRLGDRAPDISKWSTSNLSKLADPAERAVLQNTLPKPMREVGPPAVAKEHARLDDVVRALDDYVRDVLDRRETLRRTLIDAVLLRWPELANPYHARSRALLADPAAPVTTFARGRPELAALLSLDRSIAALDAQILHFQRSAARLERWLRTAQRIANEAELRRRRDPALTAALDALEACEGMVIP